MKLNFWQWLGIVLLAVGLIFFLPGRGPKDDTVTPSNTTPSTQPATTAPAPL